MRDANSILLCTHINPDGDAIGSTLAMGEALESLGKKVVMACADPVPVNLRFLPGADKIVGAEALAGMEFDTALNIDVADAGRSGDCGEAFARAGRTLQIDHHATNPGYASVNEVDGGASAAGSIVYRLLKEMQIPVTPSMAACLYCAISTDTGNFCYPGTDSEAFEIMAELMRCGLDLGKTARSVHLIREKAHVKLLGRALNTLHFFSGGKCAGMKLTAEDYALAGAQREHSSQIVNYALDMPGVEMAYLLDGGQAGVTRCSLRALTGRDVAVIARKFGGGGHVLAAGLTVEGEMDVLEAAIEEEMRRQIGENA